MAKTKEIWCWLSSTLPPWSLIFSSYYHEQELVPTSLLNSVTKGLDVLTSWFLDKIICQLMFLMCTVFLWYSLPPVSDGLSRMRLRLEALISPGGVRARWILKFPELRHQMPWRHRATWLQRQDTAFNIHTNTRSQRIKTRHSDADIAKISPFNDDDSTTGAHYTLYIRSTNNSHFNHML